MGEEYYLAVVLFKSYYYKCNLLAWAYSLLLDDCPKYKVCKIFAAVSIISFIPEAIFYPFV